MKIVNPDLMRSKTSYWGGTDKPCHTVQQPTNEMLLKINMNIFLQHRLQTSQIHINSTSTVYTFG